MLLVPMETMVAAEPVAEMRMAEQVPVVVVVLGSVNRFESAHQLLQSGWQAYDQWSAAGRPLKRS